MRVLLIPDSFKGTFQSVEIIQHFRAALAQRSPQTTLIGIPMADGGEGSLEALAGSIPHFTLKAAEVCGPLAQRGSVLAYYGQSGKTAYIEMAQAAGLTLVPETLRDPKQTTSYGVGELMRTAVEQGAQHIVMAIGGSATCDGGLGMLLALGAKVISIDPVEDKRALGCGGQLGKLTALDLEPVRQWQAAHALKVTVMCDVSNPLTGENGAVMVYGPQKGASPEDLEFLEAAMCHYEGLLDQPLLTKMPGAGAAGGLGAALAIGLRAKLVSGAALLLELVDFQRQLEAVDLVITGEGAFDQQTLNGKVAIKVLEAVKAYAPHIPVVVLAGRRGEGWESALAQGFSDVVSCSANEALVSDDPKVRLELLNQAIVRLINRHIVPHIKI